MARSIDLSSGIIVDPDGGRAFVMAPDGGVTAIAIESGEAAWHSDAAEKPLLLSDGLLLSQAAAASQAGEVRIRMLNVEAAGDVASEGTVPLPASVAPMLESQAHRGFEMTATALDGEAVVNWEFRERPLRGMPDQPAEVLPGEFLPETSPAGGLSGAFAVESDPARMVEQEDTVTRGQVLLSPKTGDVRPMVEPFLEQDLPVVPQSRGLTYAAMLSSAAEAVPEDPRQFASADGRHWMRSEPLDEADPWTTFRWTVHTSETGEALGSVHLHVGFAPFVVVNSKLLVELRPYFQIEDGEEVSEPQQLRCYDIASGERLWSQPLRDIYAVPEPPP